VNTSGLGTQIAKMDYSLLKSIVGARKSAHGLKGPSPSFFITRENGRQYIEPSFERVILDAEKPTVLLVSAVGATGKTALANQLSFELQLPLLDLAKHRPVGDNSLTGLLTTAFDVGDVTGVLAGLASGEYGVIIDGIDEGRSKTTEKAFEAFLDDIAKLCRKDSPTTFVLLGRTQILDDCLDYLSAKGVSTGLLTIMPFGLAEAKKYIDAFTTGSKSSATYLKARDAILERLGTAFAAPGGRRDADFLSFIGYPPVLDAIVTLLSEEQNYHKLLQHLESQNVEEKLEVSLLDRIARYIMSRERIEKVLPNIVTPILEDLASGAREQVLARVFTEEEQALRLVAHCLHRELKLGRCGAKVLDDKYETQLATWLPEHPFLSGRQFRNAVFESVALATLIMSEDETSLSIVRDYLGSHKHSYHLVYILDLVAKGRSVRVEAVGAIVTAALEFRSVHSLVELRITGPEWEAAVPDSTKGEIEIEIEVLFGERWEDSQAFEFRSEISPTSTLVVGPRVGLVTVAVPCSLEISGAQELELAAPVEMSARTISLRGRTLILRSQHGREAAGDIVLTAGRLETEVETITTNGVSLSIALADVGGVAYPAIQFVERAAKKEVDPLLHEKYLRLRRILMEFRSHSRGSLARYEQKINHERILKNDLGRAILRRLVRDGIVKLEGKFYHLSPERLNEKLGVSWQDLRKGLVPSRLEGYLRANV
jgi:hypothetical protein